jgi:hypothetical protein
MPDKQHLKKKHKTTLTPFLPQKEKGSTLFFCGELNPIDTLGDRYPYFHSLKLGNTHSLHWTGN